MVDRITGDFLCWLGLFFIVAFPLFLSTVGLTATSAFAVVGAIFMFFGVLAKFFGR